MKPETNARKMQKREPARSGSFVLVLNAGSSSLRYTVFDCAASPNRILFGKVDRIGSPKTSFTLNSIAGQQTELKDLPMASHVSGVEYLLKYLAEKTGL